VGRQPQLQVRRRDHAGHGEEPVPRVREPGNSLSLFNNTAPTQVYVYLSPSTSQSGVLSDALYANDTWQASKRLTLNLGLRWIASRHFCRRRRTGRPDFQRGRQRHHVVEQRRPAAGRQLRSHWRRPHTGQGELRPVLAVSSADFASSINPNASTWYRQYRWTTDLNRNGFWIGRRGALLGLNGGSVSTALDPNLANTFTHQTTTYLEREVAANFGLRTGFVWNGRRQVRATVNANRRSTRTTCRCRSAIRARTAARARRTMRDVHGLQPRGANASLPPVNITRNINEAKSDYYTWEVTATRRETGRWSLLASFAETWSHETNLTAGANSGAAYTPNALINTDNGLNMFKTWQARSTRPSVCR